VITSGLTVTVTGPPQLSVACTNDVSGLGTVCDAQIVMLLAHWIIVGGVVSLTVMRCVPVALLPQLSVAVQVRVTILLQLDPGRLWLSSNTTGGIPLQSSVAVTVAGAGTLSRHWTVVLLGTPLSTGAAMSRIHVKVRTHVAVLPQLSVAVYVSVRVLRQPSLRISPA